jgi:hypothetical protein
MYITEAGVLAFSRMFWQVKGDASPDQLIAFAGCRYEAWPVHYRNLLSAARNQTGTLQLPRSVGDGWPLNPQHFGEQVLADPQDVVAAAVAHHQQPARQPLLEAKGGGETSTFLFPG